MTERPIRDLIWRIFKMIREYGGSADTMLVNSQTRLAFLQETEDLHPRPWTAKMWIATPYGRLDIEVDDTLPPGSICLVNKSGDDTAQAIYVEMKHIPRDRVLAESNIVPFLPRHKSTHQALEEYLAKREAGDA